jgi:hypothetical protein
VFGVLLAAGVINEAIWLGAKAVGVSTNSPGTVALGIAADVVISSFGALMLALLYFSLLARAEAPARRGEYQQVRDLD